MSLVDDLKTISETIFDLSITYTVKKIEYKKAEAKLMLETDFETVLNKKRPTVGEKEAYIFLELEELKKEYDDCYYELENAKRDYEIKKMELNVQGNFLNTLAGVTKDE